MPARYTVAVNTRTATMATSSATASTAKITARKSRALPNRPELNAATAAALSVELDGNGWTQYDNAEPTMQAQTKKNGAYEVRSFWTSVINSGNGTVIRPEPWIRKRSTIDKTQGPRASLQDTLDTAGWIRAADAPWGVNARAQASPEWQTATYYTADNPDTTYYDPQPETWIRPLTSNAIAEYNGSGSGDGGGGGDEEVIDTTAADEASPAPAAPATSAKKKKATKPKLVTTRTKTTTATLQSTADSAISSLARSLLPKAATTATKVKAGTSATAASTASKLVTQTTNKLISKATNLLTSSIKSQATSAAKDVLLKQKPAPVETRVPSTPEASPAAPDNFVPPEESAPLSTGADAAEEAIANQAAPGFHFQDVTTSGGGNATISVPDAIPYSPDPLPMSDVGTSLSTIADAPLEVGANLVDNPAIFGGGDVIASELASDAAASTLTEFAIADLIPWVGGAFAVYGIGRALGLWGPSGLYAQSTGHHIVGTMTNQGFQGGITGQSSNGVDNYEFPLSNPWDYLTQINQTDAPLYQQLPDGVTVPIDLHTGMSYTLDLNNLMRKYFENPKNYNAAYTVAHGGTLPDPIAPDKPPAMIAIPGGD